MGPPANLLLALQEQVPCADFIETGTFLGETAAWAARHFPRVTTIELADQYFAAARARFEGQPQVRVVQGRSDEVLAQLVPELTGPACFWLDAHWSGLDTAGRARECPLLAELAAINQSNQPHLILVDDAGLFAAPPPLPHQASQWPTLTELLPVLAQGGRRHVVLHEDVFVAVPMAAREFLVAWLQRDITATVARQDRWWRRLGRRLLG